MCIRDSLQKAFATCFYISDSQHFERRFTPPKCVRYLAPLITHVFLCVSSFLQKLFVSWLLHATHSLCASLRSFKSVRTLSRVPRSDRVPTNKKDTRLSVFLFSGFLSVPHSDSLPFVRRFRSFKSVLCLFQLK